MTSTYFTLTILILLICLTSCQSVTYLDNLPDTGSETNSDQLIDTTIDTSSETESTTDSYTEYKSDSETESDLCAPSGTSPLVCENFETEIAVTKHVRDGNISLDTETVFDGVSSFRSETNQIESFAYISNTFAPIESGTVYFRVHLLIPSDIVIGTTKVLNLSSGDNPDLEAVQGIDINIATNYRVDIYQHGNQVRYSSEPNTVPMGEWFCLRGSYTISATAGETSVWINDGLAVSTTANTESIINGGVSQFNTGIGWTEQGQDTAVFYFDNALVDTLPVACAQPNL